MSRYRRPRHMRKKLRLPLSSPEAMASRAACRAKRRTNPSREEAAPRAFSSGAASDLSGSLEESVAMDALEWPRLAASELLGLRADRSLRHHFREVTIILDYAAAQEGRTVARPA